MRINLFVSSIQHDSFVKISIEALFDKLSTHEERLSFLDVLVNRLNEKCSKIDSMIKPIPGNDNVEIEFQNTRYVFATPPAHLISLLVKAGSTLEEFQNSLNDVIQVQSVYRSGLEINSNPANITFENLAANLRPTRAKLTV